MRQGIPLVAVGLFAMLGVAADWPQFRGPKRDGVSTETRLNTDWKAKPPDLLWTNSELGVGYSGPAVVGDRLYISAGRGESEFVTAFDISGKTPKELWATKIGPLFTWTGNEWNRGPNATPTVDGELLFALGGGGELLCVETATGAERWRVNLPRDLGGEVNPIGGGAKEPTPLGWGYAWAPLVDGDQLIAVPGGPQGLLAGLDKKSGKVLWRSKEVIDQATYSSPMLAEIGGVRQVIQVTNNGIVGVAPKDGKLLWSYRRDPPYDDVVIATPIVHGDHVFATVGFGQGCDLIKLAAKDGKIAVETVCSNRSIQNRDGGLVLVKGHLYGYSENVGWFCQEFATGKVVWSEKRKLGRGSVTAADDMLYCGSEKDGVVALVEATPKGWTEHGRLKLPKESKQRRPSGGRWTHPVIANGKLYIRDQEWLFCFDLKP